MKLLIGMVVLAVLGLAGVAFGMALDNNRAPRSVRVNVDVFEGAITNVAVAVGDVQGVGVYDWNCTDIGAGRTRCDGGVQTEEYGILNFTYAHKMAEAPCIGQGDQLRVTILDTGGQALVERRNELR